MITAQLRGQGSANKPLLKTPRARLFQEVPRARAGGPGSLAHVFAHIYLLGLVGVRGEGQP